MQKNASKNIIPSGSNMNFSNLAHNLYTRYPIVARRAWHAGRVRRASKGILHTSSQYNYLKSRYLNTTLGTFFEKTIQFMI